jgi:ABC-type multidrug transport system ATPase subunit
MNEFVAQRSAAYISQHDLHIAEMTVRETLAFSARCQGVGSRYGELKIHHLMGDNYFPHYIIVY